MIGEKPFQMYVYVCLSLGLMRGSFVVGRTTDLMNEIFPLIIYFHCEVFGPRMAHPQKDTLIVHLVVETKPNIKTKLE